MVDKRYTKGHVQWTDETLPASVEEVVDYIRHEEAVEYPLEENGLYAVHVEYEDGKEHVQIGTFLPPEQNANAYVGPFKDEYGILVQNDGAGYEMVFAGGNGNDIKIGHDKFKSKMVEFPGELYDQLKDAAIAEGLFDTLSGEEVDEKFPL